MKGGTFCGSPFSCPLFMVQPSREAIRRQWAAVLSSALFTWCTRVAKQYAVAGLGISRSAERGNGPLARRAQKGRDTYGFPPSLNSYLSLGNLANEPCGSTS